jgi:phosphoglycerol transferase MdoB-like AlkP superfamily enzyme
MLRFLVIKDEKDESARRANSKITQLKKRVAATGCWLVRIAFVSLLIIGSRLFLGLELSARGRTDALTSIASMLLVILLVERFAPRILREMLLLLTGASLLFFHLLNGLYYRFFNCPIPFDLFRQWRDVFVVGGYGLGLMSGFEWIVAVILPIFLLVWILCKPLKSKSFLVIVILLVISIIGWTHRLNRPINRSIRAKAALPDFIHRFAFYRFKLGLGRQRYLDIIGNISTDVPRALAGYSSVPGKGIMVEPVDPTQTDDHPKYNVILILMESVRAYECGFLGAEPSFTPKLDKLVKDARVYTNFYANGSQTVRAEIGLLCSIYPNPAGVPTYLVNPNLEVISLPEILGEVGYETLWFSGYTADFHNKRAFLNRHGIKKIIDRDVFPEAKEATLSWGMNDCEMFGYVWDILKDCNGPFFAQITTLSNHCAETAYPTAAQTPVAEGSDSYRRYLNGTYYTDYAVSGFIEKVQGSKLAENTIVIATGDHGLWLFPPDVTDPLRKLEIYFRTPLCILGPPELVQPGTDHTLGSHVDIPPTLMQMLNIYYENTFLGQSLLNSEVSHEERYVATFLGSIPHLRVGDVYSLSRFRLQKEEKNIGKYAKTELMGFYNREPLDFVTVEGELLRGRHNTKPFTDEDRIEAFSKRLDDITFLTTYGIYFNAFEGLR